ncbi:MAG: hypothetical protein JWQ55_2086 [Rhodopila sp.]|nr:hypothetical protein [Rhodopila sp.]
MRDRLHNALLKIKLLTDTMQRFEQRNGYLEGELKIQEQHHTSTLKEVIVLKQQLAKRASS